jgi:hypothetical protein
MVVSVKSAICSNHGVNVCNVLQFNLCSKWINSAFSELFSYLQTNLMTKLNSYFYKSCKSNLKINPSRIAENRLEYLINLYTSVNKY